MRRINWLLVLVFVIVLAFAAGCDMKPITGCTADMVVIDSVRDAQGNLTVDTVTTMKFCVL